VSCLQRGHSLIWFPEGQRGRDDQLQPLRPGIGLLLSAEPVPVVPIWIEGSDQVLPIGRLFPRRGVIRIRIGEAIAPSAIGTDQRALVESVDNALSALSTPPSSEA
jgi:1-acyl-sn-glycerol-3-phosphate acyltransferase